MEHDPGNIQRYKLPRLYVIVSLLGLLVFAGFFVFSIMLGILQPGKYSPMWSISVSLCFLAFSALSVCSLVVVSRVRLERSQEGLRKPGKPWLAWDEIASLRLVGWRACLECSDARSLRKVLVDFQLTEFEELATEILDRCSSPMASTLVSPYATSKTSKWLREVVGGVLVLALTGFFIVIGNSTYTVIMIILLPVSLAAVFLKGRQEIRNVVVADQAVCILKGKTCLLIPLDAVEAVRMRASKHIKQAPNISIVLYGEGGELAVFPTEEVDAIHLYYYLRNAIDQERARAAGAGATAVPV